MAFFSDDISINTIVGEGSAVSGNLRVNGFVRVDGDIDGNLDTPGNVIIGEKARIRGNITAAAVTVGGIVIGDISAPKSITLLSESIVIGNITTRRLQIAENTFVQGHCVSLKDEESYSKAVKEFTDKQAVLSKVM